MRVFTPLQVRAALLFVLALAATSSARAADDYYNATLALSPVSHWRLGEVSGTAMQDAVGGRHGVYTSVTLNQTGCDTSSTNTATQINGNGSFGQVAYQAALNPNGSFTVSAWVKAETYSGSQGICTTFRDQNGQKRGYALYYAADGTVVFNTGTNNSTYQISGAGKAALNTWTHVAGVFEQTGSTGNALTGNLRVFVNGTLSAQRTAEYRPNDSLAMYWGCLQLSNGTPQAATHLRGDLDEASVFARALSYDEIWALYAAGAHPVAQTFFVRPGGNDSLAGTSSALAWRTVQKAATTLRPGDTVYIGAGTYAEDVRPTIRGVPGYPIRFIGDYTGQHMGTPGLPVISPAAAARVMIDVRTSTSGFAFGHMVFEFLKFQSPHANCTVVLADAAPNMVFRDCEINSFTQGLRFAQSYFTFERCSFSNVGGDGIYNDGPTAPCTVRDCTFKAVGWTPVSHIMHANNGESSPSLYERISVEGPSTTGLKFQGSPRAQVRNCLVHKCTTGVYTFNNGYSGGQVDIWNCTIARNTGDGLTGGSVPVNLHNSIVAFNSARGWNWSGSAAFTHTYNLNFGNTNGNTHALGASEVMADPLFAATADFHLLTDSPAYDAGTSAAGTVDVDLEKNARPIAGKWDLGCYEVLPLTYLNLVDAYTQNLPLAWWRLGDGSGSTAKEEIAGRDGTYMGGPTLAQTSIIPGNTCVKFDGANDYVSVPHNAAFNLPSGTAVAWFRTEQNNSRMLLGKDNGAANKLTLHVNGGILWGDVSGRIVGSPANSVQVGTWNFAVITWSPQTGVNLYLNGTAVGTPNSYAGGVNNPNNLLLGSWNASNSYFQGPLDEVALFNRALSAREIKAIYDAALKGAVNEPSPDLWLVDDGNGLLVKIADYTQPTSTVTTYSQLKYRDSGGQLRDCNDVGAMTIDPNGIAYLIRNQTTANVLAPALLTFDLKKAKTSGDNEVNIVARAQCAGNVRGLAYDTTTNTLLALRSDRIYRLGLDGSVQTAYAPAQGLGESLTAGKDMAYDPFGNLYVSDNDDDDVYRLSTANGGIIQLWDADVGNGVGTNVAALSWDHVKQRLIGFSVRTDSLLHISLGDAGNISYPSLSSLGLTNVQAMGFMPKGVQQGSQGVRIVKWLELQ